MMGASTLSSKYEVLISKNVCERMGWRPGQKDRSLMRFPDRAGRA
jgi:hypothetical protein